MLSTILIVIGALIVGAVIGGIVVYFWIAKVIMEGIARAF